MNKKPSKQTRAKEREARIAYGLRCPKCKKPTLDLFLGGMTGQYICKNCSYLGPMAITGSSTGRGRSRRA